MSTKLPNPIFFFGGLILLTALLLACPRLASSGPILPKPMLLPGPIYQEPHGGPWGDKAPENHATPHGITGETAPSAPVVVPAAALPTQGHHPQPLVFPVPGPVPALGGQTVLPPVDTSRLQAPAGYRLGIGDLISISVWQNPELSRQLVVVPDGRIHFPLVGGIFVNGMTLEVLSQELARGLAPFVLDPEISVSLERADSMLFYILGHVNRPGGFPFSKEITVLQALSTAGGMTPYATRDEIRIFRQDGDRSRIFSFHYDEFMKGERMEQNILLKRGDVVVVL